MDFKLRGIGGLLLLGLIILLTAYWHWPRPQAEPIRLGLAVNLSGHGGTAGEYIREGALLAVEEVNAAGGINGRPLQLLISDDQNTPEGIIASDRALLEAGVVAVIGHVTSNSSLIAYPEITSKGVLMFTPYTATTELSGLDDLFFRTSVDTKLYTDAMAKLLANKQVESLVFLMDMSNPSFVTEYVELTQQRFSGRTGQVRIHPDQDMDWASVVAQVQAIGPDAVVLLTEVSMTGIAAQKLRLSGYQGSLIATLWAQTEDLMRYGGNAVEGLSLVTFIDPSNNHPEYLKFSESMQARLGKQANARSTRAFEAITILAEAIRNAPRPSAEEIKRQLLSQRFHTLMGEVEFDANGDVVREIYEVQVKDGSFIKVATLQ
ncbi:MAG: ABC transporter substrate-binding protein [Gammaproteobacteria bacterium]|nr:ABC transporter substrate-binding protein [Gammaproteobacteria bacterium]